MAPVLQSSVSLFLFIKNHMQRILQNIQLIIIIIVIQRKILLADGFGTSSIRNCLIVVRIIKSVLSDTENIFFGRTFLFVIWKSVAALQILLLLLLLLLNLFEGLVFLILIFGVVKQFAVIFAIIYVLFNFLLTVAMAFMWLFLILI